VEPIRRGYRLECCDCGLVHRLNFRLIRRGHGRAIQFQAFRQRRSPRERATIREGEIRQQDTGTKGDPLFP
jgi:hypothetical protein